MEELIDEFDVVTERGDSVRLYVYQQVIDAGSLSDPHATIRGLMRVEDEDGYGVNVIAEGEYEILSRGVNAKGRPIIVPRT